ncbi:ATP-dependent zinc protease family protein [Sneathiella aquimaris]|uniref:ATP-dependent zinc protease family protein n=1 Tax=Sneathiella aquimaris TaxID=2599305 RepID=UPI00146C35B1|nr:RimK/LysX family protein [Sneathiella aquimaris]
MKASGLRNQVGSRTVVGWREYVALPDLGVAQMRAKLDTGARTSALHAVHIKPEIIDGEDWVSFHIPISKMPKDTICRAKVIERRKIKNTSGVPEFRYVIETTLILGDFLWKIEVSLADRENMTHDLILGRTAIRRYDLLVTSGHSFLTGRIQKNGAKKRKLKSEAIKSTHKE